MTSILHNVVEGVEGIVATCKPKKLPWLDVLVNVQVFQSQGFEKLIWIELYSLITLHIC